MPDNSYWEQRQVQKYLAGEKRVNAYYKDLKKSFEQAKKEIQSVISDFYWRYAEENGLSYAAAQKRLSKAEIGDLQAFIDKVNQHMGEYNQELNNMSIKARITRYQALEKQIDVLLQDLYAIDYQIKGEDLLKDVYSDSYYRVWFNIDQYHGFHAEFAQVAPAAVEELINYPFNGADFSTRLWKQKDHMLQKLNESITTMLVQGKNPKMLAENFAKTFNTKEYEAYRLLHTESSFIMEQASQKAYKEDGVERYQWLATLDSSTCEECRPMDKKIFEVGEGIVGLSLTPKHIFCRCTTAPYYDDMETGTRVARDPETGESYEVPGDMTYEEWYKKYVESNPAALLAEKKWKNRYSDKKQYKKYRDVLGSDVPKTFDDFQNLKYNKIDEWKLTKYNYKLQSSVAQGKADALENYEKLKITDEKYKGYLFNPKNLNGYAKGRAFTSRLGYDKNNYKELDKLIKNNIGKFPAISKGITEYGEKFETIMVVEEVTGKRAKVKIGSIIENEEETPRVTTLFIDELKENN